MAEWRTVKAVVTRRIEIRPYVPGEDLAHVGISTEVKLNDGPKQGDWVARDPDNHADQWMLSAEYVAKNYEPAS